MNCLFVGRGESSVIINLPQTQVWVEVQQPNVRILNLECLWSQVCCHFDLPDAAIYSIMCVCIIRTVGEVAVNVEKVSWNRDCQLLIIFCYVGECDLLLQIV